jgi:uncharacterized protein YjiK
MMTEHAAILAAVLVLLACSPPPAAPPTPAPGASVFAGAPEQQWRLPRQLREVSGLAAGPDGRIFAHDDEAAIIYQVDVAAGRLIKNFALGDPIEAGDFEAMAIAPDGTFYLITSRGLLYAFREGADGAHVEFQTIDTGLHRVCETEGLAYFAAEESLIVACKRMNDRPMRSTISLYAGRPSAPDARAAPWLALPEANLTARAGVAHFRPSGVEIDPASGRVLLLSGSDGALAELARNGEVLSARALGPAHAQAEGIAIAADGALLISDEAAGGQATLSRYARAHE